MIEINNTENCKEESETAKNTEDIKQIIAEYLEINKNIISIKIK